jgi:ribosomal protein S12 methylthiotransferase accessory factor
VNPDERPLLGQVELFRHPAGGVLVGAPDGGLFRLRQPEADIRGLLEACDGSRTVGQLNDRWSFDGRLSELLDALAGHGCLESAASRRPEVPSTLLLIGDDDLVGLAAGGFTAVKVLGDVGEIEAADGEDAALFVLSAALDQRLLTAADHRCREAGMRWTHFHLERGRGWLGPHVRHGSTPTVGDLLARRRCASADPDLLTALAEPVPVAGSGRPDELGLRWMIGTALTDMRRWLDGGRAQAEWHEIELDPERFEVVAHPVLPYDEVERPQLLTADPHALLVDHRTGLVRAISDVDHNPAIPRSLTTVQAKVCDISRVSAWRNDPVAGGSTFGDREAAARAAVGEAVERYCGNVVQHELLTKATYAELAAVGEHAVDPDSLVLFSEKQYDAPGFPFVRFTRDLPVHWVRGHSVTRDEPAWLPASMVYANWFTPSFADDPPTNGTFFPGIAAGVDVAAATAAGLQEVVERHATMTWWLNAARLPGAHLTPELNAVWPTGSRHRYWLIPLDNEFGYPVMAGCVEDRDERLLTVGFAARPDPVQAGLKAWTEALTLQDIARDLQEERGGYRKAASAGRIDGSGLKPWRADRGYLDDFRRDFRDIVDLTAQVQAHLDPRTQDLVRPWLDVPAERLLPLPATEDLRAVVERRGYEVFRADITTPDVRAAGLRVVRTVVPGLVPNSPAAFPFLGRGVVAETAVELGWRAEPVADAEVNAVPMPHA